MGPRNLRAAARYLKGTLRAQTQYLDTDDGQRLAFEVFGPEDATRVVVLSHGFGVDSRVNWQAPGVVDALASAGLAVVAIDARGHGRSTKPHDPTAYGETRLARDLLGVVDHLGLEDWVAAGYSLGALVSLVAVLERPDAAGLFLGGVGASIVETGRLAIGEMAPEAIADALVSDDPEVTRRPEIAGFRMLADFIRADRHALAAVARSGEGRPLEVAGLDVPVMVCAGAEDPLAAGADRLAAAFPAGRFREVPGDHLGAAGSAELRAELVAFALSPGGGG